MVERERGAGYLLLFDWSKSLETTVPASVCVYTPSFSLSWEKERKKEEEEEKEKENGTVTLQIGAPHAQEFAQRTPTYKERRAAAGAGAAVVDPTFTIICVLLLRYIQGKLCAVRQLRRTITNGIRKAEEQSANDSRERRLLGLLSICFIRGRSIKRRNLEKKTSSIRFRLAGDWIL